MLTGQRKALLLDMLQRDGRLVASDLASRLALSEDTIRRDLRDLAADGHLTRVHGGALPATQPHAPFRVRHSLHTDAKARLGRAAAGLVQPGQVVIIDGGTTHLALIAAFAQDLRCTVVTHAPAIAAALEPFAGIDIVLIGGRIFRHSMVACGPVAHKEYQRLRADLCLMGVAGLHPDGGLTTGDSEEAALKATMAGAANTVAVLATDDKLGVASHWQIAPLARLDMLVTAGTRPDWLPATTAHISGSASPVDTDTRV